MSTTVELLAANERYERLRAAVEELAAEWERGAGMKHPIYSSTANRLRMVLSQDRA